VVLDCLYYTCCEDVNKKFCGKYTNKAFFDISIDGKKAGRIIFGLCGDIVPKTVKNFLALCTGEHGKGKHGKLLYYKKSVVFRIEKDLVFQGGDIYYNNGMGGESIYGYTFPDENHVLSHNKRGVLSMANSKPDTNSSQFFVIFKPYLKFDPVHTAFGEVIDGWDVIDKIEAVGGEKGVPKKLVKIEHSGEIRNGKLFNINIAEWDEDYDEKDEL